MVRLLAQTIGVALLLFGVLGFVPALVRGDLLFGIFYVNTTFNWVHVAVGLMGIWAGVYGASASRMYLRVMGGAYGFAVLLGVADNRLADTLLRGVLAASMFFAGYRVPIQKDKQTQGRLWSVYMTVLMIAALASLAVEGFGYALSRTDGQCSYRGQQVIVQATSSGFRPTAIQARMCDTLVFQNKTNGFIEIALGNHDHHLKYPGLTEGIIRPGEEKTLVVSKRGTYLIHDHLNDSHQTHLTVEW